MGFTKLLIANRGEIACRVMRTAHALGLTTVAVYSDADADAPHVGLADEAVRIGPGPVAESYLSIPAILEAVAKSGADAVHPGYGFLSENAAFADALAEAGVVFVGPPASAIRAMGDKAAAKRAMIAAGVPCVPGYQGEDQSDDRLHAAAKEIGFPLMIKASAGGGGRGMRRVHALGQVRASLKDARSEAINAFGSGDLILERAVVNARHVEIQVFADAHGNVVHLGERDCSVQRRNQKVFEEAPSPALSPETRAAMGAAAVAAARAVDYRGAGTVEFLYDETGAFYFLEMNTRLQVEHPVTELVTGTDLVAWQIAVAQGRPLPLSQDEIVLRGWAIEARLYAEDPAAGFAPQTGRIALWRAASGPNVRIDAGVRTGSVVSPFYDPMIAKVIGSGETRAEAIAALDRALANTHALGLVTNSAFLRACLARPAFQAGEATTGFIEAEFGPDGWRPRPLSPEIRALAAILAVSGRGDGLDPDAPAFSSTLGPRIVARVAFDAADPEFVELSPAGGRADAGSERAWRVRMGDLSLDVAVETRGEALGVGAVRYRIGGVTRTGVYHIDAEGLLHLESAGETARARDALRDPPLGASETSSGRVLAPMDGRVVSVDVAVGVNVEAGARLLVLEAMKMEHEIVAGRAGPVLQVLAAPGAQVAMRDLLVEIGGSEAGV